MFPEEVERTKRSLRLATPFQMASYCTDDTFADILSDAVNSIMEETNGES